MVRIDANFKEKTSIDEFNIFLRAVRVKMQLEGGSGGPKKGREAWRKKWIAVRQVKAMAKKVWRK